MAVGFKVAFFCYQIGNGDFLHSFFSTVSYNLENGKWGSRFPTIMNELYQGTLDKDNVETAIVELKKIQLELQAFSPDKVVWDIDDLSSCNNLITISLFFLSSEPVGSSAKTTEHFFIIRRAKATLCCSPPES